MIIKNTVQNSKGVFLVNTMDANFTAVNAVGYETTVHAMNESTGEANMYRILDYFHAESRSEASDNHRKMIARWSNS